MKKEPDYKIAGYIKLAKLWERTKDSALELHQNYFKEKCRNLIDGELYDVYVDITGAKNIYKRPEMLRLLGDCVYGRVNCIITPTRAYLAANHEEFCFLLHYLFSLGNRIDILTEDDDVFRINTISDIDQQREALKIMADEYSHIAGSAYGDWQTKVSEAINKMHKGDKADL